MIVVGFVMIRTPPLLLGCSDRPGDHHQARIVGFCRFCQNRTTAFVTPFMSGLGGKHKTFSNTNAAINHVAQQQTRPTTPAYAEYLRVNTDAARELATMISDFVQYGQARQKLQSLEAEAGGRVEVRLVLSATGAIRQRRLQHSRSNVLHTASTTEADSLSCLFEWRLRSHDELIE